MLRRIINIQTHQPLLWSHLHNIQIQSFNIPKAIRLHPQRNILRFSACSNPNLNSSKPDEPQQHLQSSIVNSAVSAFRGNPYVRLMRLDRPIGKNGLKYLIPQYSVISR